MQKLPFIHYKNNKIIRTELSQLSSLKIDRFDRSNTQSSEPNMQKQIKGDPLTPIQALKRKSFDNYKIPKQARPQGNRRKVSLPEQKIIENFQLIQYRKSIKHLMHIFQERSREMKSINENCIHSPHSPKKQKDIAFFNDYIINEIETTKKHKSKILHLKKKLRKSLLKTEGNESPKRKNHTDLKSILNIHSPPYSEDQLSVPSKSKHELFSYPQVQPSKNDHEKRMVRNIAADRSKRTTLGGWKIDKNETEYLY